MNTFGMPKLDVHLASDVISPRLDELFRGLGFRRDNFIGGTTGVVHPCHYSNHPDSREACRLLWDHVTAILRSASADEFFGYAEAEVTPGRFNIEIPWQPFNRAVEFPTGRLVHTTCPIDRNKDFDIHISVDLDTVDERLSELLTEQIGFYYVDIRKPGDRVVRVFTVQPVGLPQAPRLFHAWAEFLRHAGGARGKIKLEVTAAYARFPAHAPVPPALMAMPSELETIGIQESLVDIQRDAGIL
jgi:hypothetical protein